MDNRPIERYAAFKAKLITDNEAFKQSVNTIEVRLVSQMFGTTPDQSDAREKLYMKAQCLNELLSELDTLIAENEIKEIEDGQA